MTARDIAAIIEDFAPPALQESWDNSGMQIDNSGREIAGVLVCLDITEAVLDEAVANGCNMVVSHHPLLFAGLKRIDDSNCTGRCVAKAIKNDIAIYSSHTCMDKIADGVSGRMCRKLGLRDCSILEEHGPGTGFGMAGLLPDALSGQDFLSLVKNIFRAGSIRHSPFTGKAIRKVAVCGGSGAFLIDRAIEIKADAYICGDIKYHDFFKAENRILLADIGHYESEQYTKEIFFELLSKKNDKFAVRFSERDRNPVFRF